LTLGRLLIGAAALFRAVEIYRTSSSPASPLLSLGALLFGLALLWWAVVGVRALLTRDPLVEAAVIASAVADIDKRAPSGLKPLWIALAVILVAILMCVLISNLTGAT
jgi:hypothetical protein